MSEHARPRGGGHRVWVAAIAGLAVVGLVLVGIALTRQVGDPPSPVAQPVATTPTPRDDPMPRDDPPPVPDPAPGGSPTPTATAAAGAAPRDGSGSQDEEPAPDAAASALPASAPTRVRIPSLDVDTGMIDLGLTPAGEMQVPDRGEDVGWFTPSPTPGEVGPTVLAGHVTRSSQPAVFFSLGGMRPGQRAEVVREDGRTVVYEVTAVEQYPKDDFPTLRVYGNTPGPQLRLITCGGEVDSATGHFDENVVVYATMVGVVQP